MGLAARTAIVVRDGVESEVPIEQVAVAFVRPQVRRLPVFLDKWLLPVVLVLCVAHSHAFDRSRTGADRRH